MGRLKSLIGMEARRLLKFPVLELMIIPAVYRAFIRAQDFRYSSLKIVYLEAVGSSPLSQVFIGSNIIETCIFGIIYDYEFLVFIYSALAALTARDISNGYMSFLLSQPFRRSEVFAVRAALTFLAPSVAFLAPAVTSLIIVGGPIIMTANPLHAALLIIETIVLLLYIFSVSFSLAFATRGTFASMISSILLLYGLKYASAFKGSSLEALFPPMSLVRFKFSIYSIFIYGSGSWMDLPWESLLSPLAISIILIIVCYIYFTRRLEI